MRVSSEQQLHFPAIHALACKRLQSLFPGTLERLSHSQSADQALMLAIQYRMYPVCTQHFYHIQSVFQCHPQIQKALYYSVATHMHFEDHDGVETEGDTEFQTRATGLPADVLQRCKDLLDQLISHFTPILFTVATAGHMACTDVLAETWMPQVIQPALENNGLCRPIETLQAIIDLDWGAHGLCQECAAEKREEWMAEQNTVWNKVDGWLALQSTQ